MPPWLKNVISFQQKELKRNDSNWVQLATLGLDQTPRVRTVVFRGWSDLSEMEILTDKRSQKYYELESNNKVEVCWLFSTSKCQFRFSGTCNIILGMDSYYHWEKLNSQSRSMWGWPNPSEKFIYNKTVKEYDIGFPENFVLLRINIDKVDQLILNKPIHFRRRWIKKRVWIEERINP